MSEQPELTPEEVHYAVRRALGAAPVVTVKGVDPFAWSGVVRTDFRGFMVSVRADGEYAPPYEIEVVRDVLASTSDGARVLTGMYSGPAFLTLDALDHEPAADPSWEQSEETTVATRFGVIRVEDMSAGSPLAELNAATAGPGLYRVRVSARGRSIALDEIPDVPVEHYLLQVWPISAGQGDGSRARHSLE